LKVCMECGRVFCQKPGEFRCFEFHNHAHVGLVAIELELARGRQIA
jgi:hypothetical protein